MTDPEHYLKQVRAMARAACERSGHKLIRDQGLPESFQGRCSRCGHRPGGDPQYRIEGDVTGGTWQITRDGVPLGPPVPYNAPPGVEHYADDAFAARVEPESTDISITRDQTGWVVTGRIRDMTGCCDMHGRTCEPPSELCCYACTEAHHPWHADGSRCSNPDLSGMTPRPGPLEPDRD